jgi:hypothetical protein
MSNLITGKYTKTGKHESLNSGTDTHIYQFHDDNTFVYVRIETEAIPFGTTDRYLKFATGTYEIKENQVVLNGEKEPNQQLANDLLKDRRYYYADIAPYRNHRQTLSIQQLETEYKKV